MNKQDEMVSFYACDGTTFLGSYDYKDWVWTTPEGEIKKHVSLSDVLYFYYEYSVQNEWSVPDCSNVKKTMKVYSREDGHIYDSVVFSLGYIEDIEIQYNCLDETYEWEWYVCITKEEISQKTLFELWEIIVPLQHAKKFSINYDSTDDFETGSIDVNLSVFMEPLIYVVHPPVSLQEMFRLTQKWESHPRCVDETMLMM